MIERIVRRFSPNYNPPGVPSGESQINLLISTDILAEGMNLQDARVVINYDLHWNPTRLIQRIGRVDRLSREHMVVDVINFLPAKKIEAKLNLEERLRARIGEIHRIIGEDNRILHPDEQLNEQAMYAIYQKFMIDEGSGGDGVFGLDEVEQELRQLMKNDPDYWKSLVEMPAGIRSTAPAQKGKEWGALVACQLGTLQEYYVIRSNHTVARVEWEMARRILSDALEQLPLPAPEEINSLVSTVLRQFQKANRELGAKKGRGFSLPPEQRWATEQIARAREQCKDKDQVSELSRLFEVYMRPMTLPAARKELRRLRRSETDQKGSIERSIERLREIYMTYDLGRRDSGSTIIPITDVSRVLYVRVIPDNILTRVLKQEARK